MKSAHFSLLLTFALQFSIIGFAQQTEVSTAPKDLFATEFSIGQSFDCKVELGFIRQSYIDQAQPTLNLKQESTALDKCRFNIQKDGSTLKSFYILVADSKQNLLSGAPIQLDTFNVSLPLKDGILVESTAHGYLRISYEDGVFRYFWETRQTPMLESTFFLIEVEVDRDFNTVSQVFVSASTNITMDDTNKVDLKVSFIATPTL